jgi:hypothetical protein
LHQPELAVEGNAVWGSAVQAQVGLS